MIKVYQKVIDKEIGDCTSAVIASLLNLSLEEVPNFHTEPGGYTPSMFRFLKLHSVEHFGSHSPGTDLFEYVINKKPWPEENRSIFDGQCPGIDGYYYVSGPSQIFDGCLHANIWKIGEFVHDPNPQGTGVVPSAVNMIFRRNEWPLKKEFEFYWEDE